MTPMIDVIFLLLIFFVCTASFRPPEQILPTRLSLPGAITSAVKIDQDLEDLEKIVVKVLWRGDGPGWQINERDYGQLADVRQVLEAVKGVRIDLPVILDVEGAVPMKDVIDVYDLCRQVGFERVQFAASPGT